MKIRVGIDISTPTIERRATTIDDIREDVYVKEFTDKKEFITYLDDLYDGQFSDEISDSFNKESIDELSDAELDQEILNIVDFAEEKDLGFGDPNILFIVIDNKILLDHVYDINIDCKNITTEELQDAIIENTPDISDDEDPWYSDDEDFCYLDNEDYD